MSAFGCHTASSAGAHLLRDPREVRVAGLHLPVAMPVDHDRLSSCAGDSSGLVLASVSALSSVLRGRREELRELGRVVRVGDEGRRSRRPSRRACPPSARRCRPGRPPRTRPPGPSAAAPGPSRSCLSLGSSEARLIWVIVIAASPAKKSAFCARAGDRLLGEDRVVDEAQRVDHRLVGRSAQVLPSALQGAAPQPFQTGARLSRPCSRSRARPARPCRSCADGLRRRDRVVPGPVPGGDELRRGLRRRPCSIRSLLTNTPKGEVENGYA